MLIKLNQDKPADKKEVDNSGFNQKESEGRDGEDKETYVINLDSKEVSNDQETDTTVKQVVTITDNEKLDTLRRCVLFVVFLERFLEMVVVLPATLLAINWPLMRVCIVDNISAIRIFIVISVIVIFSMNCLSTYLNFLRKATAYVLREAHYLLFLLAVFFVIALDYGNLSPYVAVITAGTCGSTYLLLSMLSATHHVGSKGENLYCYGLIIPANVLITSQILYFLVFADGFHKMFMLNVSVGVFLAVLFTFENIFLVKRCIKSKLLEKFAEREETVSTSGSGYKAVLAYHQPSWDEKKQNVENV